MRAWVLVDRTHQVFAAVLVAYAWVLVECTSLGVHRTRVLVCPTQILACCTHLLDAHQRVIHAYQRLTMRLRLSHRMAWGIVDVDFRTDEQCRHVRIVGSWGHQSRCPYRETHTVLPQGNITERECTQFVFLGA